MEKPAVVTQGTVVRSFAERGRKESWRLNRKQKLRMMYYISKIDMWTFKIITVSCVMEGSYIL